MEQLFLALLKSEITGAPLTADAPDEAAQRALFRLSKRHDLAHLIGAALEKNGLLTDMKARAAFSDARVKALYRYTRLWHGYGLLTALLEESHIPFVPLKGALIRHLYPVPEMRTSSDIDLLVPEDRLEEALSLLTERLGFTQKGKTYHDINLVLGDAVHLELHYNILEDDERLDPMLRRVWEFASPAEEGKSEHRLSPDYFAFHVVSHACHHFLNGGCGVKPIIDLWLLRKQAAFDENAVKALCRASDIAVFYDAVCALGEVWLGDGAHDETTSSMQDFIFGGGAYGTVSNRTAVGANREKASRLSYALARIFMPKHRLARLYPILNKHPVLLPVCQVRRWFRTLRRGRGKNAMRELKDAASMPREKREAIRALLEDLGL